MPALKNARHERFAQALAAGKTQFDAHAEAGYSAHRGNAATLAQDKSIVERVAEIVEHREIVTAKATELVIERTALTQERILGMVLEDRELARKEGQASAALAADKMLGMELHKMFVERKQLESTQNINVSVDDRRAKAQELIEAAFGGTKRIVAGDEGAIH